MFREHDTALRQTMMFVDLTVIIAAFSFSYLIRNSYYEFFGLHIVTVYKTYPFESYIGLVPLIVIPWAGALHFAGSYQQIRGKKLGKLLHEIFLAGILAWLIFGSMAFIFKLHFVSRSLIVLSFMVTWAALALDRLTLLKTLQIIRKRGFNTRYMLVVGTGKRAQTFIQRIEKHSEWGFQIKGLIDNDPDLVGATIAGYPVLGVLSDLPELLEKVIIDEIVFAVPRSWLEKIEGSILYCEKLGKKVSLALDFYTLQIATAKHSDIDGVPIVVFHTTTDQIGQLIIKRMLDILTSSLLLALLSPFFLIIAAAIKVSSGGPVFFKQTRCSLNGRLFTMFKFRTMVNDAESQLEDLKYQNEMSGPVFKLENDPRLIRPGKLLRKFSLDELPQLFNVLRGDMSMVGPRPPIPSEVAKYEPWQRRRLSMRPGLTCIWQVTGRNKIIKFDEWMKLDLLYIDDWSLWLDLKLFFKTIPIVLFGIGAK